MSKNYKHLACHPSYHNKIKMEAAERGLTVTEYTRLLAEKTDQMGKDSKKIKRGFDFGI